jgi:hypothetical protein
MITLRANPSAVYQASIDRLMVFVVGFVYPDPSEPDRYFQLYDKFYNGSSWEWETQGGPYQFNPEVELTTSPSAIYQYPLGLDGGPDRVTAFVSGEEGRLYDDYYDVDHWQWEEAPNHGTPPSPSSTIPTKVQFAPATVYQPTIERVHCFAIGRGPTSANSTELFDQLYVNFWNGQAWQWDLVGTPNSGGRLFGPPSAIYQSNIDRVACFVKGLDGHLYDAFWNGSAWQWEDQGPPYSQDANVFVNSAPSTVYQPSINRTTCFVIGSDGHLHDAYWNQNWNQWYWEDQGTPPRVSAALFPSAVYQPTINRITCFVVGSDGQLYDKYYDGNEWLWQSLGSPMHQTNVSVLSSPSAVWQSSIDRVTCFVIGTDYQLYDVFWNGSIWEWEAQGVPS